MKIHVAIKALLTMLSVGVTGVCGIGAIVILAQASGGGFWTGLNAAIAIGLLAAGNLAVFLLNALYWGMYGAPDWMKRAVLIQALPAFAFLIYIAIEVWLH
ncbi:MAG: hypothetical protein JWQ88_2422 [Rhodoferax sp.]|nr:hypothetical protein [Rhodoferax sp.]